MSEVQKALLSAAGSVAGAGVAAKRIGRPQKSESPSAAAAKKAKASLAEHREAKRAGYFVAPSLKDVSGLKVGKKGE